METSDRLEEEYKKQRRSILGWLEDRIGIEAAEDALHDIVARSLTNLDSLEALRDLGAWLWRAARNAAIDVWRSRARHGAAGETDIDDFDEFVDDGLGDTSDDLERVELLDALYAAIDELPPDQRQVVLDQAIRGETFASISERTGTSVETLSARKRYALAKLRSTLGDFE